MLIKLKVTQTKNKPFKSSEGEMIDYFWSKGERVSDGVTIDFCGTVKHSIGDIVEAEFEKQELTNGKFRYKELAPKFSVDEDEE